MEGVRPRNVSPIKTLGPSVLIVFPTCLSTYVLAYLYAPCSRRHDTSSSARSRTLCRQSKNGRQTSTNLPSWYFSTFTNCYKVFSPMNDTWCSPAVHSSVERMCVQGRGFGWRLQGGWDVRFQCYQAISAFSEISNSIFKAIAIKVYKNINPTNQSNKFYFDNEQAAMSQKCVSLCAWGTSAIWPYQRWLVIQMQDIIQNCQALAKQIKL